MSKDKDDICWECVSMDAATSFCIALKKTIHEDISECKHFKQDSIFSYDDQMIRETNE